MAMYTDENGQTWFKYTVECANCPNEAIATVGHDESGKPIVLCENCLNEYIDKELKEVFGMCEFCNHAGTACIKSESGYVTKVCETCGSLINQLFLKAQSRDVFCAMCGYPACFNNKGEIAKSKATYPYYACEGCFDGTKMPLTEFEQHYFDSLTIPGFSEE